MGEQSVPPKENTTQNGHGDEQMDTDSEDVTQEEFEHLDNTMDAINAALDAIEQKNDTIHSQLLELLHANREIREQLHNGAVENNGESSEK